jgi:hypothetical protein
MKYQITPNDTSPQKQLLQPNYTLARVTFRAVHGVLSFVTAFFLESLHPNVVVEVFDKQTVLQSITGLYPSIFALYQVDMPGYQNQSAPNARSGL